MEFVDVLTQGHIEDFEDNLPEKFETLTHAKNDGTLIRAAFKAGWFKDAPKNEEKHVREMDPKEVVLLAREVSTKYNEARRVDPN